MKYRIISALVGIAIFIPIIIFSDTLLLPIAAAFFACIAVLELYRCIGGGRKLSYLAISLLIAAASPILVGVLRKDFLGFIGILAFEACIFVTLMFSFLVFRAGKEAFSKVAQMTLGTLYITVGFTSLVLLRQFENGLYLFLMPFYVAWITDSMAYFSGRLFGKHKLCPTISPKKTVEGAIGGLIFGVGVCVLTAFILEKCSLLSPNYWFLTVSCLVYSCLSQLGDLFASLIKREYGVKDFGNIMPGHGGVMDRFDSILFIAPVVLLTVGSVLLPEFFL